LASNLEEEYEEYGLHPIFSGLYPDEDDQREEEEPTNNIANSEEDYIANDEDVGEDLSREVPNFNGKDVDYIDFLGIDNILNSPHDDYAEFYAGEENYMFTRESMVNLFFGIFMACGREKEQQKRGKSEILTRGVHDRHQGIPMMRSVTLILGCCLVLILRKGD
jgi:hypothetical protein